MKRLVLFTLLSLAAPAAALAASLQEAPLVVDDERVRAPKRTKLVRPSTRWKHAPRASAAS